MGYYMLGMFNCSPSSQSIISLEPPENFNMDSYRYRTQKYPPRVSEKRYWFYLNHHFGVSFIKCGNLFPGKNCHSAERNDRRFEAAYFTPVPLKKAEDGRHGPEDFFPPAKHGVIFFFEFSNASKWGWYGYGMIWILFTGRVFVWMLLCPLIVIDS